MLMPITIQCPFYRADRDLRITCEVGRQRWPDMQAKRIYLREYCAGDWRRCSLAQAMQKYYDRAGGK